MEIRRMGTRVSRLGMLAALAAFVLFAPVRSARADDITDPADLHVGPGAGTACATGCGADPNVISSGSFDIYYNPNTNSSQSAIGNPFYLVIAVPDYVGSSDIVSLGPTATMYTPYPGTTTSTVTLGTATERAGTLTSGDIYSYIGLGSSVTNSFNFANMQACDEGLSGGNGCPNSSLHGSGAPLAGDTITGYQIWTVLINTNDFAPQDLLNFTGSNIPVGSFVAAIGVQGTEGWAVPFTESGIVGNTVSAPEPSSLWLMLAGLITVAFFYRRRQQFAA